MNFLGEVVFYWNILILSLVLCMLIKLILEKKVSRDPVRLLNVVWGRWIEWHAHNLSEVIAFIDTQIPYCCWVDTISRLITIICWSIDIDQAWVSFGGSPGIMGNNWVSCTPASCFIYCYFALMRTISFLFTSIISISTASLRFGGE